MRLLTTAACALTLIASVVAEERVDDAIFEIFSDHMARKEIAPQRVYDAMDEIILDDYSVDGDLKAAIREVKGQHPKLFISFGASEALNEMLPSVKIVEKKIGLKALMDRLAKDGKCRWEYTVGKGLLLHFTKTEEKDVGVFVGLE